MEVAKLSVLKFVPVLEVLMYILKFLFFRFCPEANLKSRILPARWKSANPLVGAAWLDS